MLENTEVFYFINFTQEKHTVFSIQITSCPSALLTYHMKGPQAE